MNWADTSAYRESQNEDGSFNGFAAYPMDVDESAQQPGCGGRDPPVPNTGGVRIKRLATTGMQAAHCCAA